MSGTNGFFPFATGVGANTLNDAAWSTADVLPQGFQRGEVPSIQANKAWKQSSVISAVIGQFIVDLANVDANDSQSVATLEANFIKALNAQIATQVPPPGTIRERPTANTDLYVSPSGSDSTGDGLTPQTAWATPQKAWDTIQRNYDITGIKVTVHCAGGAYMSGVLAQGPIVGSQNPSSVLFKGAGSATTSISVTNASCFNAQSGAIYSVSGFTLNATGVGAGQGAGLYATPGGILVFGADINFGTCAVAHLFAQGGQISNDGSPYVISGGAQAHLDAQNLGIVTTSTSVSLIGNPTFSLAFAVSAFYGLVYAGGAAYSGTAVGSKYSTSSGAIIVNGAGTNFFPGSLGGIVNAPGFYM